MNDNPLVYEPQAAPAPPPAPVQYDLQQTVTGKYEKKEPIILQDTFGNKLRAPWAPKKGCKRCYGRGFVGTDEKTNEMIPCRKCYPWQK